jgi:hypothetical protein
MPPPAPGRDPKETEEGRKQGGFSETRTQYGIKLTIANKVAYIEALEFGHSLQAPFGMVRVSVRELEQAMGGRQLPDGIRAIYAETWQELGLPVGTGLRHGMIRDALGMEATKIARNEVQG